MSESSERSDHSEKKVRKNIITTSQKESNSGEFSDRSDDLGIVRYQKNNHAGYRKVKNHNVAKKSSKVTVDKRYIDEMLGDRTGRLHKERDKIDGSKKGFRYTYRARQKVIRSEQEESEDDSTRGTQKELVVSMRKKKDKRER